MSDDERAADRWENEGGQIVVTSDKTMKAKMQRIATWLLPITILVMSPVILASAWKRWRRK